MASLVEMLVALKEAADNSLDLMESSSKKTKEYNEWILGRKKSPWRKNT